MENTFTEKESLDLIRQMIDTAKNNLQQGTGRIFLLWGYLVAGISLITFILLTTLQGEVRYYSYYLWFLMVLGYPLHYMLIRKMENSRIVKTYVDQLMTWVWVAFTLSIVAVVIGLLGSTLLVVNSMVEPGHEFLRWFQWLFMPPFMLCLYGFALFVSGKAYGFRPLTIGGIICWVSAFVLLAAIHHTRVLEIQQFFLFFCAIVGFIIPGHLLDKKEVSDVPAA